MKLENIAQSHVCRPPSAEDCAEAKAFLRGYSVAFSDKELAAMECWEVVLSARVRGFETAEERRKNAEREAFWSRLDADGEASDAISGIYDRDESEGRSFINQARGNLGALQNIIGQLDGRIAQAKAAQAHALLDENSQTAHEISRLIRMYESLRDEAESAKASDGSPFGAYGIAKQEVDAGSDYLEYGESMLDWGLDSAASDEWPSLSDEVLDFADGLVDDFGTINGPADLYGGVDPVGVAADNFDALYGSDDSENPIDVMTAPVRAAGDGIERVFTDAFRHIEGMARESTGGSNDLGSNIDWSAPAGQDQALEVGMSDSSSRSMKAVLAFREAFPESFRNSRVSSPILKDLLRPDSRRAALQVSSARRLKDLLNPMNTDNDGGVSDPEVHQPLLKDLLDPK